MIRSSRFGPNITIRPEDTEWESHWIDVKKNAGRAMMWKIEPGVTPEVIRNVMEGQGMLLGVRLHLFIHVSI